MNGGSVAGDGNSPPMRGDPKLKKVWATIPRLGSPREGATGDRVGAVGEFGSQTHPDPGASPSKLGITRLEANETWPGARGSPARLLVASGVVGVQQPQVRAGRLAQQPAGFAVPPVSQALAERPGKSARSGRRTQAKNHDEPRRMHPPN
ncbi:MAG: hypothetical protein U0794_14390 [Isosphaeraceae bacterium]